MGDGEAARDEESLRLLVVLDMVDLNQASAELSDVRGVARGDAELASSACV